MSRKTEGTSYTTSVPYEVEQVVRRKLSPAKRRLGKISPYKISRYVIIEKQGETYWCREIEETNPRTIQRHYNDLELAQEGHYRGRTTSWIRGGVTVNWIQKMTFVDRYQKRRESSLKNIETVSNETKTLCETSHTRPIR